MSGLTVGYLSIDKLDLEIKQAIGTEEERNAVIYCSLSFLFNKFFFHSKFPILTYLSFIGSFHSPYLEAAPLLARHSPPFKCLCNGSAPYFPG